MGSCGCGEPVGSEVLSVETITIAAARGSAFSLSEMELLLASGVVVALLAWLVLARVRRDRSSSYARYL